MKILIFLLKYGLPVLMLADLSGPIFNNLSLLNFGRLIRITILLLFIIESIRLFSLTKKYYFFHFNLLFAIILFLYLFTDRNFEEGFWIFGKSLFWLLGSGVIYTYIAKRYMVENDFINIIKYNTIIAAILSLISVFYTSNEDYNLAGYTVLFMVPMLLYFSKGLKENRVILIFAAVAVLVTMKRGAMLGFSLAIIIYFLTTVKNSLNPKTFLNTVLIAFILVSLAFYFYSSQQEMHENRFTVDQFDPNNEKAGSGRVGLYTALYNEWMSGSAEIIIFGYGNQEDSHRTIFRRTHAHSDIFGYMYNYGLVGLLLIFMLYVKLLSFRSKINRSITNDRSIILIVFVILIAVNFYSGLFRTQEALYLFMILPIVQLNNENSNGSRI